MRRDSIDLGKTGVSLLFRLYFIPTLFGMLSICAVTAVDGIFVGRGVGSDALAAVNICIAPTMVMMGITLMLGVGVSVISSINLANNNENVARANVTQAFAAVTIVNALFLTACLTSMETTGRFLGSSDTLLPLVMDYMPWIFVCCLFQSWGGIGLFVVRLDGSPKYAMWCNVVPGLLNVVLDYALIFEYEMGIAGAAIATCVSCGIGGLMVLSYLMFFARTLRLTKLNVSFECVRFAMRNVGRQCRIGVSAFVGEATMGVLMLVGNLVFMQYLGNDGVGAFSIACYYCPFVFMIGNAIAQSAQPIISYNYGLGLFSRAEETERLALASAVACGVVVTMAFCFAPETLVHLFLEDGLPAAQLAAEGFPKFAAAFIFFILNLTAIGYFQSVENVSASIIFAMLRGFVFLIPSFVIIPKLSGTSGIWLALGVSEFMTFLVIAAYYFYRKMRRRMRSSFIRW